MKRNSFIMFILAGFISYGQEVLTLQACLDKVEMNFLQTTSERSMLNSSVINREFHWWTLLPDLSVNTGINTSFGRRLDPFTNTFATSSVNSQTFGLNTNMKLFNGFTYFHQKKLFNSTIQLNEVRLDAKLNELKIHAIEIYVAICKILVQTRLTELRIDKFKQIQGIQRLLIREGRINAIDTLRSYHSLLGEQAILLDLANQSKLKTIELNFQMDLPLRTNYIVDPASISIVEEKPGFSEKYQLGVLTIELELAASELKVERSKVLPSFSLSGLVGTGFSTNNKEYSLPGNPTKSYSDQINQNLYEGIGFYLTVPLFNRGEWLKEKQLNSNRQMELMNNQELAGQLLEKHQLEQEQQLLINRAKQEQNKQMADNLQMIYDKSLLLYQEGRLTYTEIETTLMEWQLKLSDHELLKLETEILKLYE